MRRQPGGAGVLSAPPLPAPVTLLGRLAALPDCGPEPEVQRALEVLTSIRRAEEAERRGLRGPVLARTIEYLSRHEDVTGDIQQMVQKLGACPAVPMAVEYS